MGTRQVAPYVWVPALDPGDPDRAAKIAWVMEHVTRKEHFIDSGVRYDPEAMAATYEMEPNLNRRSRSYCDAFGVAQDEREHWERYVRRSSWDR